MKAETEMAGSVKAGVDRKGSNKEDARMCAIDDTGWSILNMWAA